MGASRHTELPTVRLAVLGGSGLYELAGLETVERLRLDTPFGAPSDEILVGRVEGTEVAFLARHGARHTLLPGEVNYRANLFALKRLGVERVLSASAVGSMREAIRPRDVVLVDQFIDRTRTRPATFFGDGVVVHVGMADPVCEELRTALRRAGEGTRTRLHDGGTYLCIEGPAFSTRAESRLYRSWEVDVIGMTNATEARLAREAELCYATMALVTDYDCWHEEEEDVSVSAVLDNLRANAEVAATILRGAIRELARSPRGCECGEALRTALITPPQAIAPAVAERLRPILGKYLGGE